MFSFHRPSHAKGVTVLRAEGGRPVVPRFFAMFIRFFHLPSAAVFPLASCSLSSIVQAQRASEPKAVVHRLFMSYEHFPLLQHSIFPANYLSLTPDLWSRLAATPQGEKRGIFY